MNMQVTPQHLMQIMDPSGHTTVTWDPDDAATVADARREFDRLRREGYWAYEMEPVANGAAVIETKGRRVERFDPALGKLMMVPQLVGG